MAQIDKIIEYMIKNQGEQFVLKSNEKGQLSIGGQMRSINTVMNAQQIQALVAEVLPEEQSQALRGGQPISFAYESPSGPQQIIVEQADGAVQLVIAPPGADGGGGGEAEEDQEQEETEVVVQRVAGTDRVEHLDELFQYLYDNECSDLHISSNEIPMVRQHGVMQALSNYEVSTHEHLKELLWMITPERNQEEWEACHDSDFSYDFKGIARFRCNIFMDRHGIGGVFRLIPTEIITAEELGLTEAMMDLCFLSKGLVVVTGPTGCGKSTTLAALLHHVNMNRDDHIITIEDPIEFVHENQKCLINQREVHTHTESFARALRAGLREDPDIVLVGEMRDLETIAIAIETAETGHLVFGTLHTSSAPSTVDRIIDQFPPDQQEQIRTMLSESLVAVIAQLLCRKKAGGRIAAFEILLCDSAVRNLIREGKTFQLPSIMQVGKGKGMITMNDSLCKLVKDDLIEASEAYVRSTDKVGLMQLFEKEHIDFDPGELGKEADLMT